MNQEYFPLGNYIKLCKERNKDLTAKLHWGLSSTEGLVPLPLNKGKADKSLYWIVKKGWFAVDLVHFASVGELALGRYAFDELGSVSNIHTVFNISNPNLNSEYLLLILSSHRTKNKLLHYACHGCEMVLPWEDFCNLLIRVPPPKQQEELVEKYQTVERLISLKKAINKNLEKWMECYYHILFDNLLEEQLELKSLGDLFTVRGGSTPSTKCPEYFCKEGGIPWVGIRDLSKNKGKFISRGETNITEEGYNSCSTYIVPEDSILFSCRGTIGVMAMNDQKICFTQGLFGLFGDDFLKNYYWFLLKNNLEGIKGLGRGTVMSGMGQQDLRDFQILLPTHELIYKFEKTCEPFFKLQKRNEQEIRELQKLQRYFIELTN